MKYAIRFFAEKRKKEGTYISPAQLIVEVTYQGARKRYYTGYRVCLGDFDGRVKKNKFVFEGSRKVKYNEANERLIRIEAAISDLFAHSYPSSEEIKRVVDAVLGKKEAEKRGFWVKFDEYAAIADVSDKRRQQIRGTIVLFQAFERSVKGNFTFDTVSGDTIERFQRYLLAERRIIGEKELQVRGCNAVASIVKRLRSFYNWAVEDARRRGDDPIPYPFGSVSLTKERYADPIFPTREELQQIMDHVSRKPYLNRIRDVFVFQSFCGARYSDLYNMAVSDGSLVYIPRKTRKESRSQVTVPMHPVVEEIIGRYVQSGSLIPRISNAKYNIYLKELFREAGLERVVVVINSRTGLPESKKLCDVATSHMARKAFIGGLYEKEVKDDVIAAMSGHSEGSKAFLRYRKVTEELKQRAIDRL